MTPQEQRQLNDLLQEGIRLARLLNDTAAEASLRNFNGDLRTAQLAINGLREEAKDFTSDISYAAEGFRKVVQEIRKTDQGLNQAGKSFSKLASIADKVQYHQKEISKLSLKETETLKKQASQEKAKLETANNLISEKVSRTQSYLNSIQRELDNLDRINETNGTLSEAQYARYGNLLERQIKANKELAKNQGIQNEINATIEGQNALYNGLVSTLDRINRELEEEKKLLGLGGAAVEGIGKALNKLGFGGLADQLGLDEAKKEMEETAKKIRLAGGDADSLSNKFTVLKAGISSMKSSLLTNLRDPLVIVSFLVEEIVSAFKIADTATGDLAKNFNVSYNEAVGIREELINIGNLSGDVALNARALQESMVAVGQSLGSNAMLNEADLKTFTKLREQAGYTNDELVGIQKLTLATGGTLEDNTKQFLGTVSALNAQNKLAVNEKQLLKEVANVSDAIKLSVGGTTAALAKAAFQAKQFGINLDQADVISEKLLDFESSINNQISAELITGKALNLDKARLLALNGDIAGASAEILKQVNGTAEWTKMNRIQQEALAQAVGLSRDELAKSLVDREALAKLGGKEGTAQEQYNKLRAQGLSQEQIAAKLGDAQLATQFEQQSVQERFNQSIEKLREVFISLVEPILKIVSPFMDLATKVLPLVNLALLPITFTVQVISEGIGYVVDSVSGLIGLFTGANSQLTVMQGIVGAIAGTYLAIKGYALATRIIQGVSLGIEAARGGFAARRALLESEGLIKVVGQAIFNAISAFSQMPFGIGVPLGIAAGIGIASMAAKYLSDGMINPDGGLIVSGKKGTFQLDKNDTVIAGTELGKKSPESPKSEGIKANAKEPTKSINPIPTSTSLAPKELKSISTPAPLAPKEPTKPINISLPTSLVPEGSTKFTSSPIAPISEESIKSTPLPTSTSAESIKPAKTAPPAPTAATSIDLSPMITAINNLSAKIESRPVIAQVELDGEKLTKGVMKRTTIGGTEQSKNVVKVQ